MKQLLDELIEQVQRHYNLQGPLSFSEYLHQLQEDPAGQCRGAARYLVDTFDYFGSQVIDTPTGRKTRYHLFDAEFADRQGRVAGQEEAQHAIYKLLTNFAREGHTTRLILLHGPNGSAKTSLIRAMTRAVEHYATTDQGRLYHFRWVFPSARIARGQIGFAEGEPAGRQPPGESFAHLPGEDLEAVLECECHDHPLLLLPAVQRQTLLQHLRESGQLPDDFRLPDYLRNGNLCAKCRRIHDALLAAYGGDFQQVLRHVQVLRLFPSWRYRRCLATVEPQMHVDAGEQQITASRSLASLPSAISHLSLFEYHGPLVDANRGLLEFNDLLKRPVDTFKYLLSTCETGQVTLERSTLFLDTVFIGSTNEMLLDAFKEYPDFASFKGRLELVRVPYLRQVSAEVQIYREQFPPARLGRHLAPHTFWIAALWAVLTRLQRPDTEKFSGALREVVAGLRPLDLARLYDRGQPPAKIASALARELVGALPQIYRQVGKQYEGRGGASAREVQMIIMGAAQHPERQCVSPLALLEEIRALLDEKSVFAFLQEKPDGDWRNHERIVEMVEEAYLDLLEEEAADAMGLVTEKSYRDLFERYVLHVSHQLKNERLVDPVTGQEMEPDRQLLEEVENIIRPAEEEPEQFRKALIARIGAYALDRGRQQAGPPDYTKIFPAYFEKLREAFWAERQQQIRKTYQQLLAYLDGQTPVGVEVKQLDEIRAALEQRMGYCEHCAKEAVAFLLGKRFS